MSQRVTIGVPCYNSSNTLQSVLEALADQTHPPDKVFCVDDMSTDETASIVRNCEIATLIQHDENRGQGAARNTILDHTDTPLLGLIDDDIVPNSDWLETLLQTLEREDAVLVSARIEEEIECRADRWRELRMKANPYDQAGEVPQVAGGNVLARTETYREVGGWPEGRWNSEDMIFCQRIRENGQSIYYEPSTYVVHRNGDTPESVLQRLWRWHLDSPDEVSSIVDVAIRSVNHTVKGGIYVAEDILDRRWWALPITSRLPIEFIRNDLAQINDSG